MLHPILAKDLPRGVAGYNIYKFLNKSGLRLTKAVASRQDADVILLIIEEIKGLLAGIGATLLAAAVPAMEASS